MACPMRVTHAKRPAPCDVSERELFYRLMNVEDHPEVVELARAYLPSAIGQARRLRRDTAGADFDYSPEALEHFLWADYDRTMNQYAAYSQAVEQGRVTTIPRDDMTWYLVQVAPSKLVDGSWLQNAARCEHLGRDSRLNKILSNLFLIYSGTKTVIIMNITPLTLVLIDNDDWRTEELGEGKLEQNHVFIYHKLMEDIGVRLPPTESREFAFLPLFEDCALRCAVAQMSLSLFPADMLPEILGFNLAFEQLPLHLLTTVHQMRELSIDPYYYQLHISIDNSATGHARIAIDTVNLYMDYIRDRQGAEEAARHWDRVMDGFFLANLPFPGEGRLQSIKRMLDHPNEHLIKQPGAWKKLERSQHSEVYKQMKEMMVKKAKFGARMHGQHLYIGELKIDEWLSNIVAEAERDPANADLAASSSWVDHFLDALFGSRYVDSESPRESALITQVCGFGGPMFHIFTKAELQLITDWINERARFDQQPPSAGREVMARPTEPVGDGEEWRAVAQAMAKLIEKKRKRGMCAHGNRTVTGDDGRPVKINDLLRSESASAPSILAVMRSHYGLSSGGSGSNDAATNPFLRVFLPGGGMAKFFSTDEVEVVRRWVALGGPLPLSSTHSDDDSARQDQQTSPRGDIRGSAVSLFPVDDCDVPATELAQRMIKAQSQEEDPQRRARMIKLYVGQELSETRRRFGQNAGNQLTTDWPRLQTHVASLADARLDEISRSGGSGSAEAVVEEFLPYWLSAAAPLQGLFGTPALHATDLGCAVLRVLMRTWGYPDLTSRSDFQQYLDTADQIGVALPDLRVWSADRRPLLLVQAVSAFPSMFLPEAVGIALFLAMWNHHSWQRAQLRILDSGVVYHEDNKAKRRFGKLLACFREVVALLDGDQVGRAGLGFNSMVRLASTTTTMVETTTMVRESEDAALEKAVMKWQAELECLWQRSAAAQEAHNGGSDTTLSAAM